MEVGAQTEWEYKLQWKECQKHSEKVTKKIKPSGSYYHVVSSD